MLESFLTGVLLGFSVSIPFGPINILILSYALKSFKNAFVLGLGAMSADILYLVFLQFGILNFLNNGFFLKILAIFGFLFLSYLAFSMFKSKQKALNLQEEKIDHNMFKSYLKGLMLNFFNPYIIGFWLSVATLSSSNSHPTLMVCGLIGAIFLWVFSLSFFVGRFSYFFTGRTIHYINVISAIVIEYFALSLIYKNFFEEGL